MKQLSCIQLLIMFLFSNMIQSYPEAPFFYVYESAQCEEKDARTTFSFDDADSARNKPLYSQKEEIDNFIGRFSRMSRQRDVPQSSFIDIAREMVNSDDEYKAEKNYVRYLLFKYTLLGYAGVAVVFFGAGYFTHYAFS